MTKLTPLLGKNLTKRQVKRITQAVELAAERFEDDPHDDSDEGKFG